MTASCQNVKECRGMSENKRKNKKKHPIWLDNNNPEVVKSFKLYSGKKSERKDYIFFKKGNPLVAPTEPESETKTKT